MSERKHGCFFNMVMDIIRIVGDSRMGDVGCIRCLLVIRENVFKEDGVLGYEYMF